jgi:phosphatidylinositol-3-phosphatase
MRARHIAISGLVVLALGAGVVAPQGDGKGPSGDRSPQRRHGAEPDRHIAAQTGAAGSHVFMIVLENREFGQVVGNSRAPYINRLARRGALATRYFAITHPSLPNYLAIIGGSTFGIRSDCTDCSARDPNLALQLDHAGISWRAYMEGMPQPCYRGASSGNYVKKHNPFAYFPSIAGDPARCANVVPGGRLDRDLERDSLASFSWITPDICQDAHDCGIGASDRYLATTVPKLLRDLGSDGFLVLTFDEGITDRGCCGGARGGRIATIVAGPGVRHRTRLKRAYDHYSLLRTLEDAFSLGHIRKARGARSMRAAFESFPAVGSKGAG